MPVIPPSLLDVVVAIGVPQPDRSDRWIGTGFLYSRVIGPGEGGRARVRGYLVTNRHVAEAHDVLTIRLNPRGTPPARGYIEAIDRDRKKPMWTFHPDPAVDVAVTAALHGHLKNFGLVERLAPLLSTQAFPLQRLRSLQVSEGDAVAVAGFPMELVTVPKTRPVVRSGCIARISDVYDEGGNSFLLDVPVFPGNSGGPAFLLPQLMSVTDQPPTAEGGLLGVVRAYVPYEDFAVSAQTGQVRVMFQENSGLTLIHTVDCIDETIAALEAEHPLATDP